MQNAEDGFATRVDAWGKLDMFFLPFKGGGEEPVENRHIHAAVLDRRVEESIKLVVKVRGWNEVRLAKDLVLTRQHLGE